MSSATRKIFDDAITRIRAMRYFVAICLFIFSLLLFPLLFFPFPPGADSGHMLALSYTFEGTYVEGSLKYPPLLPFLMFLFYRISFGNIGVIFTFIKIFGVALIFPLGTAFYLLSKQLGKNQRAANFGFFLAVLNPLFVYEILWGGYAQFLGMTFAILSMFWLYKAEEGSKYGGLACAFFAALTVWSHIYTSIFLCIFLLVYSIVRIIKTDKKLAVLRNLGKIAVLIVLFSIPCFFSYWNILNDLKTTPYPGSVWDSVKGEILVSNPVLGLELVVLVIIAISFYARHRRSLTKSTEVLSTLAISGGLMFFLTPAVSANRALYFLMIPAIILISVSLSKMRLSKRLSSDVRNIAHSRKGMRIEGLVLCLVLLAASTSLIQYFLALGRFTPLGSNSLDAFKAIKGDSDVNDKVLVTSYWPEFDSWWLEGITKCEALERGSVRWFILQSEVDRVILGKTLLFGTHVVDGGDLKLLDNSPYLTHYSHIILTVSGAGALGIITIADASTTVAVHPIANSSDEQVTMYPLSPGEPEIRSINSLFIKYAEKWGILEKTLLLDSNQDLASIKYSFKSDNSSINNVTLGISSYNEILFKDYQQNGKIFYITYKHEWEGITGSLKIEAKTSATVTGQFIKKNMNGSSHLSLTFTPQSLNGTELNVSIEVKIKGIDVSTPTTYSIYEKLEVEQIRYVYIRGESWLKEKFEQDPCFKVFFEKGEVVVYKYIGEPRNTPNTEKGLRNS